MTNLLFTLLMLQTPAVPHKSPVVIHATAKRQNKPFVKRMENLAAGVSGWSVESPKAATLHFSCSDEYSEVYAKVPKGTSIVEIVGEDNGDINCMYIGYE